MSAVIGATQTALVSDVRRVRLYKEVIKELEDMDWDTQDECLGEDPAFDQAMTELHPDTFGAHETGAT